MVLSFFFFLWVGNPDTKVINRVTRLLSEVPLAVINYPLKVKLFTYPLKDLRLPSQAGLPRWISVSCTIHSLLSPIKHFTKY